MEPRSVIITGAAGSLGSALSSRLFNAGWRVVMLDSNRKKLEQVFDSLDESAAGEAALYPMDLAGANPELFEDLLHSVHTEFGGLDALVHCAVEFKNLSPSEHVPPADWLMGVQVNLNAPWLLSVMAMPGLRSSPVGKLAFLLEDLDKVEKALWGVYGVSKHALRALVNQLAEECRGTGVDVRGVNPGPMRSPVRTGVYHSENPADMPSPGLAAARIADWLEGRETWDSVTVDFRTD